MEEGSQAQVFQASHKFMAVNNSMHSSVFRVYEEGLFDDANNNMKNRAAWQVVCSLSLRSTL